MPDASGAVRAMLSHQVPNPVRSLARLPLATLTCAIALSLAHPRAQAQAAHPSTAVLTQNTGQVVDQFGAVIPRAEIYDAATGKLFGKTDEMGKLTLTCAAPCTVRIVAKGFQTTQAEWQSATLIPLPIDPKYDGGYQGPCCFEPDPRLPAERPALEETIDTTPQETPPPPPAPLANVVPPVQHTVTVTAYRAPLGELESPASTRTLTQADLQQAAAITLDGQLRLIPGAETFRRSSSLVANPSSQGISLRGLGSTSASRTLVTEDDVPLNDAFAGWIHWEELPELSIHSVEVVRGGASDLYGSSAIGGVINVMQQRPTDNRAELKSDYGSEDTYDTSLLVSGRRGPWGAMATGGVLGTDGFVITAPNQRGLIDVPSNVHAQNGLALLDRQQGPLRVFLRGSALNEARDNGTPVQKNGTRIWRFSTGGDWKPDDGPFTGSTVIFRAYGSTEHYRQTFSTIGAGRNSETLNRFAKTPDDEMGAVAHWSRPITPELLLLVGADTHDVRAGDFETVVPASQIDTYVNLHDRQRQTGAYAELLWTHQAWTISGSGRVDWFSNFDGQQFQPTVTALPRIGQRVFDPRLGISRKLGTHFALTGSGFRAYRAPTANELYRSTQVGSLLTLPNNDLHSERATGWETGVAMEQHWGTVRVSYFWTQVNRPITALTLCATCNPIKLMRENLGQIESRGVSLDYEFHPAAPSWNWMTLQGGYQYTNATVTQGTGDAPAGNWIPQVAHNMASAQLRGYKPAIGTLSIQARASGHQFDDDANTYLLHSYFKLDAYASHDFGKRIQLFTSGENLLNRQIEVGRTPTLTLGTPRVARIGFLFKLGSSVQ